MRDGVGLPVHAKPLRRLENIFEKLDVHTRTAALARAFGAKT
jgi:hypothetical protein